MDDKREQFAQSVLTWILEEMRYRPDTTGKFAGASLPTIQDLKKLCRGNTVAMWQYFLDHIRSKRYTQLFFCFFVCVFWRASVLLSHLPRSSGFNV
jgi:hypothetical protein